MDFKAAIFDFDGTLVDSMRVWSTIAMSWAKKNGIELTDELLNTAKYATVEEIKDYIRIHYKHINIGRVVRQWSLRALYHYLVTIHPLEGAKEYLRLLHEKGVKIAIATNCPPFLCRTTLVRLGMNRYIDALVSSRSVGKSKSEPDIFLKAASILGVEPPRCMVYEDSHVAIEGVRKANMKLTAVFEPTSPFREKMEREADRFILSYRELIDELNK